MTTSIEGRMSITMPELLALEKELGVDITKEGQRRFAEAQRRSGGIRGDGTRYTVDDMIWGLYGELFGCEAFGERMDFTIYNRGDTHDFTKPLTWNGKPETRFDIKSSRRGKELIVNSRVLGKADAYILATGQPGGGYQLLAWMTAPDIATFPTGERAGNEKKYICPTYELREIEELRQLIANGTPLANTRQKVSTW